MIENIKKFLTKEYKKATGETLFVDKRMERLTFLCSLFLDKEQMFALTNTIRLADWNDEGGRKRNGQK